MWGENWQPIRNKAAVTSCLLTSRSTLCGWFSPTFTQEESVTLNCFPQAPSLSNRENNSWQRFRRLCLLAGPAIGTMVMTFMTESHSTARGCEVLTAVWLSHWNKEAEPAKTNNATTARPRMKHVRFNEKARKWERRAKLIAVCEDFLMRVQAE